jgi:nicotinamide-nucleotide adenylyltransferase
MHPPYPLGVIHGRFQVLHHDHLRYLLAGQRLCEHLVVGVTNPDPVLTRQVAADPRRGTALANPLTYFERQVMVGAALTAAGVPAGSFSVVPLPITSPELYRYYVPLEAVFFLTICDDWGRQKKAWFEELGLTVHVLWDVPPEHKGQQASDIRERMARNEPWQNLVPPAVAALLAAWGIPSRLARLAAEAESA